MNEIHYNLENGNHVFRKKRESVEEALFYNKEYFARIGFPNAEIRIESATTGGSYNPNKVTVPFRQFVYLVQGNNNKKNGFSFFGKSNPDNAEKEPNKTESNNYNYWPVKRLGLYNAVDYMKTGFNQLMKPSKKAEDNVADATTDNVADATTDNVADATTDNVADATTDNVADATTDNVADATTDNMIDTLPQENGLGYWVVEIPVAKSEYIEPKGKCEMEEVKLMQTILQRKAQRTISLNVEYEYKTIDERVIMLCKRIKEKGEPTDEVELNRCKLKGTIMDKYSRKIKAD